MCSSSLHLSLGSVLSRWSMSPNFLLLELPSPSFCWVLLTSLLVALIQTILLRIVFSFPWNKRLAKHATLMIQLFNSNCLARATNEQLKNKLQSLFKIFKSSNLEGLNIFFSRHRSWPGRAQCKQIGTIVLQKETCKYTVSN